MNLKAVDGKLSPVVADYESIISNLKDQIIDLEVRLENCENRDSKNLESDGIGDTSDSLIRTAKKILRDNWKEPFQKGKSGNNFCRNMIFLHFF